MPKEVVYGVGVPWGTPEEPGPARTIVELGWSAGTGHVEIATRCVRAVDGSVYKAKPGEPGSDEDLARQGIPRTHGIYAGLDREGINRLIRQLRRARDQAFGRDE